MSIRNATICIMMILSAACEKWDYGQRDFASVLTTGIGMENLNQAHISARLDGLDVDSKVIRAGHCWSDQTPLPTLLNTSITAEGPTDTIRSAFTSLLPGLDLGTQYFTRAFVVIQNTSRRDTFYEATAVSFTTSSFLITSSSVSIEGNTAKVISNISGLKNNPVTTFGHCWSSQTTTPTVTAGADTTNLGSLYRDTTFTDYLIGLEPAVTYYVRAYAQYNGQYYYGKTLAVSLVNIWIKRKSFLTNEVGNMTAFALKEKIYFGMGGNNPAFRNVWWRYDPQTDEWEQIEDFPGPPRDEGAVSVTIGDKAYVGLGKLEWTDPNEKDTFYYDDWYAYDEFNGWVKKASFAGGKRAHAIAFSIGTMGYVGTGRELFHPLNTPIYIYGSRDKNDFWEYDPNEDKWTRKADFGGTKRREAVGFAIGSRGMVGSGRTGSTTNQNGLNDFWEYNPNEDNWTRKADLGAYGRYSAFAFAINSFAYVGAGIGGNSFFTDFWKYNPQFDDWTTVSTIPDGLERSRATSVATSKYGFVDSGGNGFNVYGEVPFWMFIPEE